MGKKILGFTLIEMLVGIVIGMIVVAAASVMMVSVLKSQKDITASARLNQELGAAMAVMSNEIRRAGFRVCDVSADNATEFMCPDNDGDGEEDPIIPSYALGDDIKIGDVDGTVPPVKGDCILYRYNADVDDLDDPEEQRGVRLNGDFIEIAGTTGAVTCGNDANWVPLTDSDVIRITALSFSTMGSKCRNMTGNFYWVVGTGATGLACDVSTNLDTSVGCVDLNDPADPGVVAAGCDTSATAVKTEWVTDEFVNQPVPTPVPPYKDALFGVNQININLRADLTRDSAVSKSLQTSVKVANPWIRIR